MREKVEKQQQQQEMRTESEEAAMITMPSVENGKYAHITRIPRK